MLEHLRSKPEDSHKSLRFGARDSPLYPVLHQQGVLACPLVCGAYFNGVETGVSKPLELHIARHTCSDRRRPAPPAELNGPYLATTMAGVRAAFTAQARNAMLDPISPPPHKVAVEFCSMHADISPLHMRTSGCQSAVAIPKPNIPTLLLVLMELLIRLRTSEEMPYGMQRGTRSSYFPPLV